MAILDKEERVGCFHCGDLCTFEDIVLAEKHFCCSSCLNVYQILNDNNLCYYYNLNEQSGIKNKKKTNNDYSYLDEAAISDELLQFKSETRNHLYWHLPEIHCSSCVWLLENLNKLDKGIILSEVNFQKKDIFIAFNPKLSSLRKIADLLEKLNYSPLFDRKKQATKKFNPHYLKLALAGFAFGNVMLLSFPEYLDSSFANSTYRFPFSMFSLAFSLPVLLYCAKDYFKSAYESLKQNNINLDVPISIGILALFIRSLIDIFILNESGFLDSFCGFIFFLLLGKTFQMKYYDHLNFERDYKSYFPLSILRKEKGEFKPVLIEKIIETDFIKLRNGEVLACDAKLLSTHASINYSFVSGEAEAVNCLLGDVIFAGGRNNGHAIELVVIRALNQSYLTQLWMNGDQKKTSRKNLIELVAAKFSLIVVIVAILTIFYTWQFGILEVLNRFSAVLIVACPCALALSRPFTFGTISNILAKSGFFIREVQSIETLAKADTLIFDKTGTLTNNKSSTVSANLENDKYKNVLGFIFKQSSHPLSQKVASYIESDLNFTIENYDEKIGLGIVTIIDNMEYIIGSEKLLKLYYVKCEEAPNGFAETLIHIAVNRKYLGYYKIKFAYREGIENLAENLKKEHRLFLLSGDNDSEKIILNKLFPSDALLFKQDPIAKENFINSEEKAGHICVMLGDGLNDAGALKRASIGISVSEDKSQFTPACDAILSSEKLKYLDRYIQLSKDAFLITKLSLILSISYNSVGLYFAVTGSLTPLVSAILMPLSSLTVISFTVLSSIFCSVKRGV